jgi:hypothetical protein
MNSPFTAHCTADAAFDFVPDLHAIFMSIGVPVTMKKLSVSLAFATFALVAQDSSTLPPPQVSITTTATERIIKSNGIPDHGPGQFPRRGNPNSVSAQQLEFHMPLKPVIAAQPTPSRHASYGVALNGVPFEMGTAEYWNFDQSSGWNYDALSGKINLGLDEHNAHVQPTGLYHYHALPIGLNGRQGIDDGTRMLLLGYAADGFPIYSAYDHVDSKDAKSALKKMRSSYQFRKGTRPSGPGGAYDGTFAEDYEYVAGSGDLDECNGRVGITPEYPEGTYHYCLTEQFPQLARLWKGTPDASFQKKGPPPGGRGGPGGARRGGPGAGEPDLLGPNFPFGP